MAAHSSSTALSRTTFTAKQRNRGFVLLGLFLVLRVILLWVWNRFFGGGYSTDPLFLVLLGGIFLLLSVGLVYFGFTRWVGIDLYAWWFDRERLRGDLGWGVIGVVGIIIATVIGVLALSVAFPGLSQPTEPVTEPTPGVPAGADTAGPVVTLLLGWFFGFAIAAFQEETLFRGFLQQVLEDRYGRITAIVGQAAVFALAHLTYYPRSAWPLIFIVFFVGLITGWLVDRRGTLLAAGIAHGFVG